MRLLGHQTVQLATSNAKEQSGNQRSPITVRRHIGLDQINIGPLPRSLAGRGEVDVVSTADAKVANTVRISVK